MTVPTISVPVPKPFKDNCLSYNLVMILAFVSVAKSLSDVMFNQNSRMKETVSQEAMRNLLGALLVAYGYHLVWDYLCKTKQYKIAATLIAIPFAYALVFLLGYPKLLEFWTNSPFSNNNLNNSVLRNLNTANRYTLNRGPRIPMIDDDDEPIRRPVRRPPPREETTSPSPPSRPPRPDTAPPLNSMKAANNTVPVTRSPTPYSSAPPALVGSPKGGLGLGASPAAYNA